METTGQKWRSLISRAFLDFLYPPLCICCQGHLPEDLNILCSECLTTLTFPDPDEYCRGCFLPFEDPLHPHCKKCVKNPSPFTRIFAVLEETPPIFTLRQKLKTFSGVHLAKGIAALMAYYYLKERGKRPQLIVGLPEGFWGNPSASELLAKELASLFQVPLAKGLIRNKIDKGFSKKKGILSVEDRSILFIADRLSSSFFQAGELLLEGFPKELYGLAFSFYPEV